MIADRKTKTFLCIVAVGASVAIGPQRTAAQEFTWTGKAVGPLWTWMRP